MKCSYCTKTYVMCLPYLSIRYALCFSKLLNRALNEGMKSTSSSILLVNELSTTMVMGYLSRFCWNIRFLSIVRTIAKLLLIHSLRSLPFFKPFQRICVTVKTSYSFRCCFSRLVTHSSSKIFI